MVLHEGLRPDPPVIFPSKGRSSHFNSSLSLPVVSPYPIFVELAWEPVTPGTRAEKSKQGSENQRLTAVVQLAA